MYAANLDRFTNFNSQDDAIQELINPVFDHLSGAEIMSASSASHIPFSIDLTNYNGNDISYKYITGNSIEISVAMKLKKLNASTTIEMMLAPIVVKYRW